jgi:hypothetical protein
MRAALKIASKKENKKENRKRTTPLVWQVVYSKKKLVMEENYYLN